MAFPGCSIVVKVDRSGGITHLVSWWQHVIQHYTKTQGIIEFFYIFLTTSDNAIARVRQLWDFLWDKMSRATSDRLKVNFAACVRPPDLDCHADVPAAVISKCQAQLEAQGVFVRIKQLLACGMNTRGNSLLPTSTIKEPPEQLQA